MAKPIPKKPVKAPVAVKEPESFEAPADQDRGDGSGGRPSGARNKAVAHMKETEVLQSVQGLDFDKVSAHIASTQTDVQKSLASLSAKLMERLQVLQDVDKAIQVRKQELQELYDIEAAAVDLDELHAKIESQREAWEDEEAKKRREWTEQDSDRNKSWARAESEYQYDQSQKHKKAEDAFNQRMADLEKANRNKQEQLDKGWAEREAELKKRETEVADLRAKVEKFPEDVKKEVNGAVAVATNSVKKEYETKIVLANKDAEMAQKLGAQEVNSQKAEIGSLKAEVASLKAQLDQARHDVKEISGKALESASGRDALAQVSKFMEREPSSKPGK